MVPTLKIIKWINIVALVFLILGGYGLPVTGILQVFAAVLFLLLFSKNKLIYGYFALLIVFFLAWDFKSFGWLFLIPVFLIFFLTYIIYKQKTEL